MRRAALACLVLGGVGPAVVAQEPVVSVQPTESHEFTNRLAGEASPYLLQHAHNPVDWWPWGPEAIAEARRRDVPIFLSIGYSTCYWCHVMERESFESPSIAALMNERFVCVKVDREQRPDLDEIYMAATQIMTGHGGWPMSVFIEPGSLRPFYCGTYWPAEPRAGMGQMPTFPRVLEVMSGLWRDERGEVMEQAASLGEAVRLHLAGAAAGQGTPLGVETVQGAATVLLKMFDRQHGGFGGAPKFPQPVYLDLLLDIRERAGDDATRAALDQAIRHTLDKMAIGGMRDQVGGGFHRYSVDATWTVPHFEKMLYDNAMLAEVYARAGAMYGDDYYRAVAQSTVEYVLRAMTRREGGSARGAGDAGAAIAFHTAQDAEVDHREGLNYLWTPESMRAALEGKVDAADVEWALEVLGVSRGANFRDPHHPEEAPANVLRLDARPDELARRMGISAEEFEWRMARVCGVLLAARDQRKQPHLDDKAILSWNALMVRALAACAGSDPSSPESREWLASAFGVARWLLGTMRTEDGTLVRVWRQGRAQTGALLEDYAAMTRALVTLAHTPGASEGDAAWALGEARTFIEEGEALFGDGAGGFYDTREGATDLFVRSRATYDGAMPSGPGLMALALAELAVRTREAGDVERAVGAIGSISGAIAENPVGSAVGTRALLTMLREPGLAGGRLGYDAMGSRVAGAPEGAGSGHAGGGGTATSLDFTPVEVFAPEERLVVRVGEPASLRLLVRVAPGYHIVAAEPGGEVGGLVPFRVEIVDAGAGGGGRGQVGRGDGGLSAYADYPAGTEFAPSALAGSVRVYEGEFELLVALERREGVRAPARPVLVVSFQACTATECLRPQRLELDVAIDMP